MIYAFTEMGINGEIAQGIKESTTPKGVGFCGGRHRDRVAFAALINPALSKV